MKNRGNLFTFHFIYSFMLFSIETKLYINEYRVELSIKPVSHLDGCQAKNNTAPLQIHIKEEIRSIKLTTFIRLSHKIGVY